MNDTPPAMDETARRLAEEWIFEPKIELPGGHCSRVFADASRVLKVPFQGEEMTSGLVAAVRMSGGIGPRVSAWDEDSGVILMDRLLPGTPLWQAGLSDEDALQIVVSFAQELRELPTDGLMTMADFVGKDDPLGQELLDTTPDEVFLHGDLHHSNILLGPTGWVVIDPKGIIGDPAFEPSGFIRNPIEEIGEWEDLSAILERRILRFAQELELDPWRIWGWSLVMVRDGGTEPGHPWDRVRKTLEGLNFR